MSAKYRSIDLFAGIGGIRLGFERAFGDEISTDFVSEWDEYAQKTYKANFDTPKGKDGETEVYGDITLDETKDAIPEFDICLAGFPCQAFSMAGRVEGSKGLMTMSRGSGVETRAIWLRRVGAP